MSNYWDSEAWEPTNLDLFENPEWESFTAETETDPEEWVSQNYDELGSLADLI